MAISNPTGLISFTSTSTSPITGTFSFDNTRVRHRVAIQFHVEYTNTPTSVTCSLTKQGGGTFSPTEVTNSPVTTSVAAGVNEAVYFWTLDDADVATVVNGGANPYVSTGTITVTGGSLVRGLQCHMYYITETAQGVTMTVYGNSSGSGAGGTALTAGSTPATSGCMIVTGSTSNSTSLINEGSAGGTWTMLYEASSIDSQNRAHSQYLAYTSTVTPDATAAGSGIWAMGALLFTPAVGNITSVTDSNTLIDEQAFTITGTNLGSATAVTIKQTSRSNFDATSYITSNTSTTVELSGIDIQDIGMAYGAATVSVTTAGGESNNFSITLDKKSGQQYITLSGHTSGQGWALDEASANGDILVAPTTTVQGGTFTFVGTTGDFTISYPTSVPSGDTAYWAWFDDSADQWYESTGIVLFTSGGGLTLTLGLNV